MSVRGAAWREGFTDRCSFKDRRAGSCPGAVGTWSTGGVQEAAVGARSCPFFSNRVMLVINDRLTVSVGGGGHPIRLSCGMSSFDSSHKGMCVPKED